jgi:hypothetical protein
MLVFSALLACGAINSFAFFDDAGNIVAPDMAQNMLRYSETPHLPVSIERASHVFLRTLPQFQSGAVTAIKVSSLLKLSQVSVHYFFTNTYHSLCISYFRRCYKME